MTSAEALARVRTLLDEATAAFWTDAEVYSALTDGQNEVITMKLNEFRVKSKFDLSTPLPETLRPLISTTTGTGSQNLPSGYLDYISVVETASGYDVYVRDYTKNRDHLKNNTYLASSSTVPYCSFNATQIAFETSVAWSLDYLAQPADIASGTDPTLEDEAMNAVIHYAFAFLLKKDDDQRAYQEFAEFLQLVQNLY